MSENPPSGVVTAADPFTSLAVHFGMLLGVPDLETVVGHAWSKMRLHNAWLHGAGVVWGYRVSVHAAQREVRVDPGLALDGLGRELYLPVPCCLDIAQWYAGHAAELPGVPPAAGSTVTFDAHVVARFRACLARPVPALVSPCEGAEAETAYSRLQETVELCLRPGLAPHRGTPYPRLRRLLGSPAELSDGDASAVEAARASGVGPGAWLDLVRRFAADDTVALEPAGFGGEGGSALFPVTEPSEVVLADLHRLSFSGSTATVDRVDHGVRWSHVATTTLSELAARAEADAGGPRAEAALARRNGATITIPLTGEVVAPTVGPWSVTVTRLDPATGWTEVPVAAAGYAANSITVTLADPPPAADVSLRVLLRGTGPRPIAGLIGGRPVPLAGLVGGPPTGTEGRDAAVTIEGS